MARGCDCWEWRPDEVAAEREAIYNAILAAFPPGPGEGHDEYAAGLNEALLIVKGRGWL